ncbi:u3 small [Nesidiocoris tenuis]|uniref:U3 small n=1 Tax=Nesidiocoris tenuis TaxID=355587 RepID=A0ABN7B7R9_9HEMI|nr:u3 small [Nesidiocoris tenuis]
MSSFFIRPKKPTVGKKVGKSSGKNKKVKIHDAPNKRANKKRKLSALERDGGDEEITSDEDELDNKQQDKGQDEFDEEEMLTPQEKKLQLAKKYLEEIQEEESKKAGGVVENGAVLSRLRADVLKQEGKFKRRIADRIIREYSDSSLVRLSCKEHRLSITCLAVSDDGKFAFTGSKDASIVKWCLTERKKIACVPPKHKNPSNPNLHSSSILCLALSSDSRYLAAGDKGSEIRMWDANSLAFIFTFKGHRAAVTGLAFCRNAQNLYSASADKTVKVWSVAERAYVETLFGHQAPISSLDFLAKDRVVTGGGSDMSARVWKIDEESQLIFNGHQKSVDQVRKLSDVHFVSCGDDGLVCVWGVNKKKPLHKIPTAHGIDSSGESRWIVSVACVTNTEIFASGSSDGFVRLWKCDDNYRGATELASVPVAGFVNALAFTPDGQNLLIGVGQEHRLGRWSRIKEAKNSLLLLRVKTPEDSVGS